MNQIDIKITNDMLNIKYYGNLFKNNSEYVFIKYGYTDNWYNINERNMERTENGFEIDINILNGYNNISFCFYNGKGEWDNNQGLNYTFDLKHYIEGSKKSLNDSFNKIDEMKNKERRIKNDINNILERINNEIKLPNSSSDYLEQIKEKNELESNRLKIEKDKNENIKNYYEQENVNVNEGNILKDRGTLLISEVKNKVYLPYTVEEVLNEVKNRNNEYKTVEEVIENMFTKPFDYYKFPFVSRFKESVILITQREKMSLKDGISLGTELCKKRYLHPAIISACKNLDELNVYLDCLDKNELDDFKIFKICYEMLPVVCENGFNSKINKIEKIFNSLSFSKKGAKE